MADLVVLTAPILAAALAAACIHIRRHRERAAIIARLCESFDGERDLNPDGTARHERG